MLNTGTAPAAPPIDGLEGTPYWTNRDAVTADRAARRRSSCIGGGAIGCEFAQVFARYGVDVTVVEVADRLVAVEEPEASELLAEGVRRRGHHGARPGPRSTRSPTTTAGSPLERGRQVDAGREAAGRRRAAAPTSPTSAWTPWASTRRPAGGRDRRADARRREALGDRRHHRQGRLHARLDVPGRGRGPRHARARTVPGPTTAPSPRVTFTAPEVASVGLSEKAARDAGPRRRGRRPATSVLAAGWPRRRAWSSWSPTASAASWSAACVVGRVRRRDHVDARGSRCTRRSRSPRCFSMHFAYPTYHRALEHALKELDLTKG